MNINEIKPGNYYTNGRGVYVMASGAVQDNEFEATNIELGQVRMYPISEFSHCTFHEAFRDNVNRIVIESLSNQHKEVLWDSESKSCLAISDLQKKWILDHYVLKHEVDVNFAEYVKLKEAHSVLICEYKDLQNRATGFLSENNKLKEEILKWKETATFECNDSVYSRDRLETLSNENQQLKNKILELKTSLDNQSRDYISLKEKVLKNQHVHNDSVWYIGELKKFIQHLQDYIASKHLEENGLILEKFIEGGK